MAVPRTSPPILLAALLVGCASSEGAVEAGYVSGELEARAGSGTRPVEEEPEALPPGVELADGVTSDEAVAVALWRNAGFLEALGQLELSRADVLQAGLLRDPTFSFLFPWGPKQYEWTLAAPLGDLWQRPYRVAAARLESQRTAELLVQHGLDLVRDVRVAHADWVLAGERARLAGEEVQLRERLAELERARADAGDASPAVALEARTAADRAGAIASRLAGDVQVASARFWALLGFEQGPQAAPVPADEASESASALVELREQAYASRPDLRACELAIEAASERVGLARAEAWQVTALLDANQNGSEGFEAGPGLLVTLPIFSGSRGRKARLSAELEQAALRYVTVRQAIALEVAVAELGLEAAAREAALWRAGILPGLEQRVSIANEAFAAGELSRIDVVQARLASLAGSVRLAELSAELQRAQAELERSVGGRPPSPGSPRGEERP